MRRSDSASPDPAAITSTTCAAPVATTASRRSAATFTASGWSNCRRNCGRPVSSSASIEGARSAARLHAHAAPAARRRRGCCRWRRWSSSLTASASRSSSSRPALSAFAEGDWSRRLPVDDTHVARDEVGRARRRVQPHGRPAAPAAGAPRLPDADGQLAVAGAQDRARAEELADADPTHGRGDARRASRGRSRVHGSGRADRGERNRLARAARARVFRVCERAAEWCSKPSMSTRWSPSASRCCGASTPTRTFSCGSIRRGPRVPTPPPISSRAS